MPKEPVRGRHEERTVNAFIFLKKLAYTPLHGRVPLAHRALLALPRSVVEATFAQSAVEIIALSSAIDVHVLG